MLQIHTNLCISCVLTTFNKDDDDDDDDKCHTLSNRPERI